MSGERTIRVVVADDSDTIRLLLRQLLTPAHGFDVVGEAADGARCIELVCERRPDLVVLDVDMPGTDGLEATREIMRKAPTPIVIFTSSAVSARRQVPFKALAAGALDVLQKPSVPSPEGLREMAEQLRARLRLLAKIKVIRRPILAPPPAAPARAPEPPPAPRILAVGASTGGPAAVVKLLRALSPARSFSILLVQHMSADFMPGFVEWLGETVRLPIRQAGHGDRPEPGAVLVAPGGRHLALGSAGMVRLDDSEPRHSCRPSADVLFESVAEHAAPRAVGVLLTGIGVDGAAGLLRMRRGGCLTVAQDEESSVVFGMPKAAIELGAAAHIVALDRIGRFLHEAVP